jgi:2-polyprenyl-3-methyl-5-hydroxy-6-metoxy-1,4-benzoquinol methylase
VLEAAQIALRRCVACNVYFNSPRPTTAFIDRNYNDSGHYLKFTPDAKWESLWHRRLDRVLSFSPKGRILDVSAGVGTTVKLLSDRGYEAIGSEISKEAVVRAKALYGINLMQGFAEQLPLEASSLGCVMMWHVFEHLPFPGATLAHLAGKMRAGGLLVLAVPNNSMARIARYPKLWFAPRAAKLEKVVGRIDYGKGFQEIHLIHFTPSSLRGTVERAGFRVLHLGLDNTLSPWRDAKLPLRNFAARWLGFNDGPAMMLVAEKTA